MYALSFAQFLNLFSPDPKNEKGGRVILEHDVYTYDTGATGALVSLHYWTLGNNPLEVQR